MGIVRLWAVRCSMSVVFGIALNASVYAASPTKNSNVGDQVDNPITGKKAVITAVIKDPIGVLTAGHVAFVILHDELNPETKYSILVKQVGEPLYFGAPDRSKYIIQSITNNQADLKLVSSSNIDFQSTIPVGSEIKLFGRKYAQLSRINSQIPGANLPISVDEGGAGASSEEIQENENTNPRVQSAQVFASNGKSIQTQGEDDYGLQAKSQGQTSESSGGSVLVVTSGNSSIETQGSSSHGLFAQSLAGNGELPSGEPVDVESSDGGSVHVSNAGEIITTNEVSNAILAQSIGKGDSGDGGSISVYNASIGTIETRGDRSTGILAQSIGGGKAPPSAITDATGFGTEDLNLNPFDAIHGLFHNGDDGSDGGDAGSVIVNNSAGISTFGSIQSHGLVAQSIGGGGGNGGDGSRFLPGGGGAGGRSGAGSNVKVINSGVISTLGSNSSGLLAQSIGGGGGLGGDAKNFVWIIPNGSGGSGATGNRGGSVTIHNSGSVSTFGDDSIGVLAQSIGGGGGKAGLSVFDGTSEDGGNGGDGGAVDVALGVRPDQSTSISTKGDRADGVFVQSVGGTGGVGGEVISSPFYHGDVIGGRGGSGGNGGDVNLSNLNQPHLPVSISTQGSDSTGIYVQSVGGGGGAGGAAYAVSLGIEALSVANSIGGAGGDGGDGGKVSVGKTPGEGQFTQNILTKGTRSTGFLAQSVGGGGGSGGFSISVPIDVGIFGSASVGVSLGGTGGKGGDGGDVSTSTKGDIETQGSNSTAYILQSLGGGGGIGGATIDIAAAANLDVSAAVSVGIGGQGGDGGTGGGVEAVINEGHFKTSGENSSGLLIQSLGGGGGHGGYSISGAIALAGAAAGAGSLSIGGSGGSGNSGGAVTATLKNSVSTFGKNSSAVIVQSIGGGGGHGGYSVSGSIAAAGGGAAALGGSIGGSGGGGNDGGNVTFTSSDNDVHTQAESSTGITVQSIGGGGGSGGFSVTGTGAGAGGVAVNLGGAHGGLGGQGGKGGEVIASIETDVSTQGLNSSGIVVQSLGGGGGNGGFAVAGSLAGAGGGTISSDTSLGGNGGSGAAAQKVTSNYDGTITTQGDNATALLVQSVGGGGGNGGFSVAASGSGSGIGSVSVNASVGGTGGTGGEGGEVNFTGGKKSKIHIETHGDNSAGVIVHSVGGGGGNGGFSVAADGSGSGGIALDLAAGLGGDGEIGGISQNAVGDIGTKNIGAVLSTHGNNATAFLVQSLGGGGGNGGFVVAGAAAGAGGGAGSGAFSLGGKGGSGNASGRSDLLFDGKVLTTGKYSGGLVSQSIGGGGGNGGFSIAATGSGAGVGAGSLSISMGGTGGDGGISQKATGNAKGHIITQGDHSTGMLVQSIGGGGGNGGFNVAFGAAGAGVGAGAAAVSLGGSGGSGNSADVAELTFEGKVSTSGDHSIAIASQSIGGGGGYGGFNVSVAASGAGVGAGSGAAGLASFGPINLGGTGGHGGVGANASGNVIGEFTTVGDYSAGVMIQSIGGGGGHGGFNLTFAGVGAGGGAGGLAIGLGGTGGSGNESGNAHLDFEGSVSTQGTNSSGLISQSIGGGGGDGGFSVSVAVAGAGAGAGAVAASLGGTGGTGGHSQLATLTSHTLEGTIQTNGKKSNGVIVQSVGGGGGSGGFSIAVTGAGSGGGAGEAAFALGGRGEAGGNAGDVELDFTNKSVATSGDHSAAIVAQSVGGGGGSGGFSLSIAVAGAGAGSGAGSVSIGGGGEGGGHAGSVNSKVSSTITTTGDKATGILAQSVGGGGGDGGFSIAASINGAGEGAGAVSLGIGGWGGGGGHAGDVTNNFTGNITTSGNHSDGLLAQSLGGGGGSGGFDISGSITLSGGVGGAVAVGIGGFGGDGGDAKEVTNISKGNITTKGSTSNAVLAQSVGGGGGSGGLNVSGAINFAAGVDGTATFGMGGFGGGGGGGGAINNTSSGSLRTDGDHSAGILAQSVGGGGGAGGLNVSGSISVSSGSASGALAVGFGGLGAGGGDASSVENNFSGNVITNGDHSTGIMAQSVGGGGGHGGINVSEGISFNAKGASGAIGVGIGGFGGGGGHSNAVTSTVNVDRLISTSGKHSQALFAQSVGGGGGKGAINVSGATSIAKSASGSISLGIGGFGGDGGHSASVNHIVDSMDKLSAKPNITTSGKHSQAILTQSLSGGGGAGGLNVDHSVSISRAGPSGVISIGLGGFGGKASSVQGTTHSIVKNIGTISTHGDSSDVISTLSQGGGGGAGGINISGGLNVEQKLGGTLILGVGGLGGKGGNSGDVISQVTNVDQVVAFGDNSRGIIAQSLAGGGGRGGLNVSGSINVNSGNGGFLTAGIGGFGGAGGDAKKVNVDAATNITMYGNDTIGLLAQSVGGGGGDGGINISGEMNVSNLKEDSSVGAPGIVFGMGGFGGSGGDAGDVNVNYTGDITALPDPNLVDPIPNAINTTLVLHSDGFNSHGLIAQSIGGGGGNGGLNVSGMVNYNSKMKEQAPSNQIGVFFGIGGFGGGGGDAGNVTLNVGEGSNIRSHGAGSLGVAASSVGGGGGNGAFNFSGGITSNLPVVFGIGGDGGAGGLGKDVEVNVQSDITVISYPDGTTKKVKDEHDRDAVEAHMDDLSKVGASDGKVQTAGLLAQSIGGGGGSGGLNISHATSLLKNSAVPTLVLGIGGHGGAANKSGKVNVTQAGMINTDGDYKHGILAQSIAGGGGIGGGNFSTLLQRGEANNRPAYEDVSVNIGIGGVAGAGADSQAVSIQSDGHITTNGSGSRGVFGQSIGGGGGSGGMNVVASISTNSNPMSFGVGGMGGGGGHGGTVSISRGSIGSNAGLISTNGFYAHGIEASSIGGGGGSGGNSILASLDLKSEGPVTEREPVAEPEPISGRLPPSRPFSQQRTAPGTDTSVMKAQTRASKNMGQMFDSLSGVSKGGTSKTGNFEGSSKKVAFSQRLASLDGIAAQAVENAKMAETAAASQMAPTSVISNLLTKSHIGLQMAVGGYGKDAGNSDDVIVKNYGNIITKGNSSAGIIAQSIGGGGGNAGSTKAYLLQYGLSPDVKDLGMQVVIGGGTGFGGNGENATVTHNGTIETQGNSSQGIIVQSIGGGGGNASSSDSYYDMATFNFAAKLGRQGSEGGTGGDVSAHLESGAIHTAGHFSHGVLVQSIGGGGGNSAASDMAVGSNAGSVPGLSGPGVAGLIPKTIPIGVDFSFGQTGGKGANSGNAHVDTAIDIQTEGKNAIGVFAQSVGGGGGVGSHAGNSMLGTNLAMTVIMDIGGAGGKSGNVDVKNSGKISTQGIYSHGILAQSVGGGGGMGVALGNHNNNEASSHKDGAIATHDSTGNEKDEEFSSLPSIQMFMGVHGGSGGEAGNVDVINNGQIYTQGKKAHGIFAQSVGGGGGVAISFLGKQTSILPTIYGIKPNSIGHSFTMSIGGVGSFDNEGGNGNDGGDVTVTNNGLIVVDGKGAIGVLAQSVGGGGGKVTAASEGFFNFKKGIASNINLGGQYGIDGDGGDVSVTHNGTIQSSGDNSYGIYAQSLAGGGGKHDGKFAAHSHNKSMHSTFLNIGGGDDTKGKVGDVTVNSNGTIEMSGANSHAIFNQALNGGGGVSFQDATYGDTAQGNAIAHLGGTKISGASASSITSKQNGDLVTRGHNSAAGVLQSIGGGGGDQTFMFDAQDESSFFAGMALGAVDTHSSHGGSINFEKKGNVATYGNASMGHLIHSIGGGGGRIFVANSLNGQIVKDSSGIVTLGADPSFNNNGGQINIENTGFTVTNNEFSSGWIVQSVGAGGGEAYLFGLNHLIAGLGARDDSTGDGGDVSFNNIGSIQTKGRLSHGILVQSIGGGGGHVSSDAPEEQIFITKNTDNGGDGGTITVHQDGSVEALGEQSIAVAIQSIGGGGGLVNNIFKGSSGGVGRGGDINLDIDGNVIGDSVQGIAVFAQSVGRDGAGDIAINLNGIIKGGTGNATKYGALIMDGGENNTVSLSKDSVVFALNNQAILASTGNETINSSALVVGNVDLGAGNNRFNSAQSGYLGTLDTFNVGAGGILNSDGILDPGAIITNSGYSSKGEPGRYQYQVEHFNAQTTNLTGALNLGKTSRYIVDVRALANNKTGEHESDLINATQNVTIAGEVIHNLLQLQAAKPLTIIQTPMGIDNQGAFVNDSVFIDYELDEKQNENAQNAIDLIINTRFARQGMNKNQSNLGYYINGVLNGEGSAPLGNLFAMLGSLTDEPTAFDYIDRLTGEFYAVPQSMAYYESLAISQNIMSNLFVQDENACLNAICTWGATSFMGRVSRSQTFDYQGSQQRWDEAYSAGMHKVIAADSFAGVSFGQRRSSASNSLGSQGASHGGYLGIYGGKKTGILSMEGALTYSRNNFEGTRNVGINGSLIDGTQVNLGSGSLRQTTDVFNAHIGASLNFAANNGFYATPGIGLDLTYLRANSAYETGLGAAGLHLHNHGNLIATLTPKFEMGLNKRYGPHEFNFNVNGSIAFASSDRLGVKASFLGAPESAGTFNAFSGIDKTLFNVGAGMRYKNLDHNAYVDLSMSHKFSKNAKWNHSLNVGLGFKF